MQHYYIGIPKETLKGENRVAASLDTLKKYLKLGFKAKIEKGALDAAGFSEDDFKLEGLEFVEANQAWSCDIVCRIHRPSPEEIDKMKPGALLVALLADLSEDYLGLLAKKGIQALSLELIPRTSRAQSMDVLSSQANIAGYRAVLEAAVNYPRFFPMMMTSAGSAKQAKVIVLGAGVAGLQAIGTARRLGAQVEAYDVRPEVKEQIHSLGAKYIDLDVGESGSGQGGYAKELSEEAKKRQQALLGEYLKKADLIITTANIPGRKAPLLITEETVKGMRKGSVIIDMAAATGGNCALTEEEKTLKKEGVTIVGRTNYPSLVAFDASQFFAKNIFNLLALFFETKDGQTTIKYNLEDDIIAAALVTYQGQIRFSKKGGN